MRQYGPLIRRLKLWPAGACFLAAGVSKGPPDLLDSTSNHQPVTQLPQARLCLGPFSFRLRRVVAMLPT